MHAGQHARRGHGRTSRSARTKYLSTLDDGLRTVAMPFTLAGYEAPARAARRPGEDDDDVPGED